MIEAGAVAAALGLPRVSAATRMAGFDATVWRADLVDGRTVALRLLRPGADTAREIEKLALAHRHTALAPALLADGTYDGRGVLALQWCPGRAIGELLIYGDVERLGRSFGQAQRALHRPVDGAVLCHLDYQPFNVLADDSATVTAIVDWTNARLGDPREDLARTAVVLELAPAVVPDLEPVIAAFRAGWQTGYDAYPGGDELEPFLVAAAQVQLADWAARPTAPQAVRQRATEIAARHRQ